MACARTSPGSRTPCRAAEPERAGTKAELSGRMSSPRCTTRCCRAWDPRVPGYETTDADARVVAILRDGIEYETLEAVPEIDCGPRVGHRELVLDRTPFYAESGGRWPTRARCTTCPTASTGWRMAGRGDEALFDVTDVQRVAGTRLRGSRPPGTLRGRSPSADRVSRSWTRSAGPTSCATTRGPTLHRGCATSWASGLARGSLVAPDALRFDFPFDRALTEGEKRDIERECAASSARTGRCRSSGYDGVPRPPARTRSSTRSTAIASAPSGSRVSATSCAAARTAAPAARWELRDTGERSIGSGCGASRPDRCRGRPPEEERFATLERAPRSSGRGRRSHRGGARRAPGRAARGEAPAPSRGPRGSRPTPAPGRGASEIAPGVRFVGAALDLESIDDSRASRRTSADRCQRRDRLGLDADEPQLFVTVSDDLVQRGFEAGPLVQGAVSAIEGAAADAGDGPGTGNAPGGARDASRPCGPPLAAPGAA